MTVALFQSVLKTNEGETVWGSLKQKVVDAAEAPAHIAEGWFESAQDALDAHELASLEADNAKLEAKIAEEQVKLDGRSKAARDLKAKNAPVVEAPNVLSGSDSTVSTTPASDTSADLPHNFGVPIIDSPPSATPDAPAV
jgi:hypothetical protein